jgi:hypothetical protein
VKRDGLGGVVCLAGGKCGKRRGKTKKKLTQNTEEAHREYGERTTGVGKSFDFFDADAENAKQL